MESLSLSLSLPCQFAFQVNKLISPKQRKKDKETGRESGGKEEGGREGGTERRSDISQGKLETSIGL